MTPLFIVISLLAASTIAGLLMGWLHYWLSKAFGREITQPWTYVIGVGLGIFLPFAAWCLVYGALVHWVMPAWLPVVAFFSITAGAGIVTLVCYDADKRDEERKKARKGERLLDAQREQ